MAYQREFVCLANSVKKGGRCIAGKEIVRNGAGQWIRPISDRTTAEVVVSEYRYASHGIPQLLDIITVGFAAPKPHSHQTENHVIDGSRWRKTGRLSYAQLDSMVDTRPSLWGEGEHTFGGVNDCISPEAAAVYDHSLLLIKPLDLVIHVGIEGNLFQKRAVRAGFTYMDTRYALKVTDPLADASFRLKQDGQYTFDAYLCVSLTEPFTGDGRCHKLAAAILSEQKF